MKKLLMCLVMAIMAFGFSNQAMAQSVKTTPKSSQVAKKKTMPKVNNEKAAKVAPKKSSATVTKKAPASSATNKEMPASNAQKKANPKSTATDAKVFPRNDQETKIKIEGNRSPVSVKKESAQKATKQ